MTHNHIQAHFRPLRSAPQPEDGLFYLTDMAHKNRYINTHFWDDSYIVDCDPIEKLLFLYLLTSPLNNIAGCYEIQLRRIAFDTGIDKDMVLKIIRRFEEDNKMYYIEGHILIMNFMKHQKLNQNIVTGIANVLESLPEKIKATKPYQSLTKAFQSLLKDSNYLNINFNINYNSKENLNSEKIESFEFEKIASEPCDDEKNSRYGKTDKFKPPRSIDDPELVTFFANNGSTPDEAKAFFAHYDSQSWLKSNNMPVSNWESLAIAWIRRSLHDPTFSKKAATMTDEERSTIENRMKYYGY